MHIILSELHLYKQFVIGIVHHRIMRSLERSNTIDDCVVNELFDAVVNQYFPYHQDVRVELVMKDALEMHQIESTDVSWIFS